MSSVIEAEAPVTFTEGAVKELLKLRDQQELSDEFALRIGVEGGGCAGMNYVLGFDQRKDGDKPDSHGVTVPDSNQNCSPPTLASGTRAM